MTGRMRAREVTPRRMAEALVRRLADVPHSLAWRFSSLARENQHRLAAFRDIHRGERCVVMANGPSLATMDLAPIAGVPTFGLNRIYLLFDRLPVPPTYYVAVNELVLEQFAGEISQLSMPRFVNWNQRRRFDTGDPKVLFLRSRLGLRDRFSSNVAASVDSGGTVTFVALQLAFYMGFEEVVLVGLDHRFKQKGIPNRTEVREAARDPDHFHPEYFPRGSRWQIPDLLRSELAFRAARESFEADGRRILDATPGGACPVFERTNFHSLFRGVR